MMTEVRLAAIALPGLSPDSLGSYLASLGLLRVLARKWSCARIAWCDEVLQVIGGPQTLDEMLDELVRVADASAWTPYERGWLAQQKKGTAEQSGRPLALWQSQADEKQLGLFIAHAVPHARVSYNPLTGTGGNAMKRIFSSGWGKAKTALGEAVSKFAAEKVKHGQAIATADTACDAATAIAKTETARTKAVEKHRKAIEKANEAFQKNIDPAAELKNLLLGKPGEWMLEKLNSASWFSDSNKLYNSGQSAFREGQISPWAMVLACEGLAFFAGGASRRLGALSRAVGAFPFVTQPAAPDAAGEAGRILGEIWTPLWSRPMTLAEAQTLFSRGRAELRGRGARKPADFATAIRKRGVDAGISKFGRFTLGRTTSTKTFEPSFKDWFAVGAEAAKTDAATTLTLERATELIEHRGFPHDRKVGQRWRYEGLRGPIEVALLRVAAEPDQPEAGIALLDAIVSALDRIDRNRSFREGKVRWEPLPLEWLASLFADEEPGIEARLALSLVSAFPAAQPFATYRFGVEWKYGKTYANYTHTDRPPASWVWGPGGLARVLGIVLSRKLLDQETDANKPHQRGRAPLPATSSQVRQWLVGDLDELLFAKWLARLALFDWRSVPQEVRAIVQRDDTSVLKADGELALLGLFQPLVDQRPLVIRDLSDDDLLDEETGARTTEAARSLVTLIRADNLDAAWRLASSRYAMAHARLAAFDVAFAADSPDRLVAALLFTLTGRDRAALFERWLRPRRRPQRGEAHV